MWYFEDYYRKFMVEFVKVYEVIEYKRNNYIYDFFLILEYVKFFKFNVEWWINVRFIFLLYYYNIDSFSKSGWVYFVVKFLNVWYKMI